MKLVAPESTAGVGDGDSTGSSEQGSANTAVLENELAIRDETVDQLDRENAELKSRLDDLQEQNSTSEQLLKLRNDQIAQLQEELRKLREAKGVESGSDDPLMAEPEPVAEAGEAEADAAVAEAEAATDEAVEPEAVDEAESSESMVEGEEAGEEASELADTDATTETDATGDDAVDADSETQEPVAAEPAVTKAPEVVKPKPAAPAQPPAVSEPGIVDLLMENLLYIALGLLALLLVIFLVLRGKARTLRRQASCLMTPTTLMTRMSSVYSLTTSKPPLS